MPRYADLSSLIIATLRADRIYRTNGKVEDLTEHSLEAYQKAVGGYIEPYLRGEGKIVYVNEEGLLLGLPFNPYLPIVGDFVVVREEDA
jgi:hypothetical protein